jgi:hypothetical protein
LICPGDSVEFSILNFIEAISWSVDSSILALPDTQITYVARIPGIYQVTYTSPDGCQSTATAPIFDLYDAVDTVELGNFGNVVQIPAGVDPFWELDGERIDETQLRFCATASGTYTLVLMDIQTGCVSRSSIEVAYDPDLNCDITPTNNAAQRITNWSVFPNPSSGPIRLTGTEVSTGSIEASLVSITGSVLYHCYFEVSERNWQSDEMILPELPAGVYFLLIESQEGVQNLPVIRR